MPEENENKSNEGTVTLTAEQYDALLTRAEQNTEKDKKGKKDYSDYDTLVNEGRTPDDRGGKSVSLNDLSNEEFAGYLEEQLRDNALNPLATAIEGLRLDMEFMGLKGTKGFEDLMEYKKDVLGVMDENPNMSVEKAFKLVKLEKGEKGEKEEKSEKGDITKEMGLPQRLAGEKPGMTNSSTKDKPPETLKESAEAALDEAGIID